jgi:CAAX protease family protein
MGTFLGSATGADLLRGNWAEYALIVVMCLLNTVLGEELLFRGLLLPRMQKAFGRADWVANGALFTVNHLHQPWSMPLSILIGLPMAYATKRLRCAWMGIITHSAASVMIAGLSLALVLS